MRFMTKKHCIAMIFCCALNKIIFIKRSGMKTNLQKTAPSGKRILILPSVLSVSLLFVGCVSSGAHSDPQVLERSSAFKPAWAVDDFSDEGDGPKQLHYRKSEVFRLELGIKQAQAAGIEQSCELLQKRIEKDLQEKAESGPWKSQPWISKIPMAVSKIRSADKCPVAQPKFVYWELLRKDTGEGLREVYAIDVLLAVKRADYRDSLFFALNALKTTEGKAVEGFVKDVAESFAEIRDEDAATESP
jgi:hypothetical protein